MCSSDLGTELQGIHEDTEQHPRPQPAAYRVAGPLEKGAMALVQRPHRRHEVQGAFRLFQPPESQLGAGGEQSHAFRRQRPTCQGQVGQG